MVLKAQDEATKKDLENSQKEMNRSVGNKLVPQPKKENSRKGDNGSMFQSVRLEKNIDDLADLLKQIVIYQRMEDRWGDLDEKEFLEEGEVLADSGNLLKEIDITKCKDIAPFRNDLILEVSKEEGKDSKHKPNQRKKAKKKTNNVSKGVETRSNKVDQQV